jgi:pimeloyl-ACP methyl ester carboxylesterase
MRAINSLLAVVVCSVPVLAGPPEPEWLGHLRRAVDSAAVEFKEIDARVSSRMATLREDLHARLLKEAKAVEVQRGLHAFVPGGVRDRGSWSHAGETGPLPERIILLIHGLDEPGGIWTDLAPELAAAGYDVLRFDYRNDDSISASATDLERAMRSMRARGVRRADLVCHSMGGLVARDVLTRPGAYAGGGRGHEDLPDVHRLITLGTPNNGSIWAHLAPLADVREHLGRWMSDPAEPRHLLGFMLDGDNSAGRDLLPGSAYLEELNARPLPEDVRITAIVASMTEIGDEDLACLTEPGIAARVLGPDRAGALAEGVRRASSFLGDGVVCIDSGASVCLEDVVTVRANHRTMVRNFDLVASARRAVGAEASAPPAIPIILDRLASLDRIHEDRD